MNHVLIFTAGFILGIFIAVFSITLSIVVALREKDRDLTKEEWKNGKRPKINY